MTIRTIGGGLAALSLAVLAGCAGQPQFQRAGSFDRPDNLFDPARAIQQGWREAVLIPDADDRRTDYRIGSYQDRLSIQATGQRSASALLLAVDFDVEDCPYLEWDWRVERQQESASLFERDLEDVAASILVLFGDPMLDAAGIAQRSVPTLRYAWTTQRVPEETIIDSPAQPGMVRSVVVQGGVESPLAWKSERRDLVADYQAAFGRLPQDRAQAIALFTDNDDTQEPVTAHYGGARLLCSGG